MPPCRRAPAPPPRPARAPAARALPSPRAACPPLATRLPRPPAVPQAIMRFVGKAAGYGGYVEIDMLGPKVRRGEERRGGEEA